MKMSARQLRRFLRHPITIVFVAVGVGAIAGLLVFLVSAVTGWKLYLLSGALIGVITGLVVVLYVRRTFGFTLSEVTLSVPEFAELKFAVNTQHRRAAWRLFIETLTRITTQPLPSEDGSLREALTSLYGVFTSTRELLKTVEPSKTAEGVTVEMLAIRMLNDEIRPFLAKWHVQLRKFESGNPSAREADWPQNAVCREELERLRNRLIDYSVGFGELGGVDDVHAFFRPLKGRK